MRERAPGMWELIVEAGRDPVTGKRRQVSRTFHGTVSAAKKARAALLVEVGKGRHTGTAATVDHLFEEWVIELERKGRSPNTVHGYKKTYRRNIQPTLGGLKLTKVTTKTLTDLYREHQARGLAPATVYQIHACLSSMFTQACRWGWRENNPAQWADPPSIPNRTPTVPTAEDVIALIEEAERSRRPDKARALFVAATTGVRRAELCALRVKRDFDRERSMLTVAWSIAALPGRPLEEIPTKNRRERRIALDELTFTMLVTQVDFLTERARAAGADVIDDAYIFSDVIDGSAPWKPDSITQFFGRLRARVGRDHLDFHYLRKFMETYGQDLGFSPAQVALRAGHNPAVAAKHYIGNVHETDRALAAAVASLLVPGGGSSVVRAPDS